MKQTAGVVLALSAGVMWGIMGIFIRHFSSLGLGSLEIGQIRIFFALIATLVYLLLCHRDLLRIRLKDLWCFVGGGVLSVMLFCYTNFKAMQFIPISVATILVYTAPIFITLFSALLFKERITLKTVIALALSFFGCVLVCGIGGGEKLSPLGIALGLISGFVYSLYSIFSRFAINRGYRAWTITFYSFLLCVLVGAIFCDWPSIGAVMSVPGNWLWAAGLGVCCGFAPYTLYSLSLERIRSSAASVLSSVDPVVATLVSVWVFNEPFGIGGVIGIIMVLSAILILSGNVRSRAAQE